MSKFKTILARTAAASAAIVMVSVTTPPARAKQVLRGDRPAQYEQVKRERIARNPIVSRRGVRERYVVVRPRSFLDSGNVVPMGVTNNYVHQIVYRDPPTLAKISPGLLWKPEPSLNPWSLYREGGLSF